jgi:hypothetical protein
MKKINRFRSKYSTNNKEYKYLAHEWADIDWDYGYNAKVSYGESWAKRRGKMMWQNQYRQWRTWKYNRKTQYK